MGGYKTVVVGTDGSDSSLRAVDRAGYLASGPDAKVIVATAYFPASEDTRAADLLKDEGYKMSGNAPIYAILREAKDRAMAAGATDVVLADGFKDSVADLTGGRGVDIVMDPVGGDRFTDSLRSLAPAGRLLVVGFTGGEIPTVKVNRLLLNNIDVVGVGWGAWTMTHPGSLTEQWDGLAELLTSGRLAAPQPEVYPLEQAAAAVSALENRTAKGKVVVRVRD